MTCCKKKSEADLRSAAIDKEMSLLKKQIRSEVKMLLLGPGDSGKSTFAKQIKILHLDGFTDNERASYRPIVYSNLILTMKSLIIATKNFGYKLQKTSRKSARHLTDNFFIFPEDEPLGAAIGQDIDIVWADPAIQQTFRRRVEFNLLDCAKYYMENVKRISDDDYLPNNQDILHARQRTRGIIETTYSVNKTPFRIVDVGGQRNERNKWIHCFDSVTAILYCASLSEYNQKLEEDPSINRMKESLTLWEGICRYRWFNETAFILFLNKTDIFKAKIQKIPLTSCFEEYEKPDSKDEDEISQHAMNYIRDRYVERKSLDKRHVKVHFTCATDTSKIQVVFDAIVSHLLARHLEEAYIL